MSDHERRRSKSPDRHDRKQRRRTPPSTEPRPLPFGVRGLSRHHDLEGYRPLFGLYLDVQKRIELADLEDHEAKGRWKSFVNKWYGCGTHQPFQDHYQQNSADMLGTMEIWQKAGTILPPMTRLSRLPQHPPKHCPELPSLITNPKMSSALPLPFPTLKHLEHRRHPDSPQVLDLQYQRPPTSSPTANSLPKTQQPPVTLNT